MCKYCSREAAGKEGGSTGRKETFSSRPAKKLSILDFRLRHLCQAACMMTLPAREGEREGCRQSLPNHLVAAAAA